MQQEVDSRMIERELNSTIVQPTLNDLLVLTKRLQQKDEDLGGLSEETVFRTLLTETIILLQKENIAP